MLVAQALVHKPPVIVLDEPTAGVDVELRQTLWKFISRLNQEGHTIVLTTHYLEEAEALCNRIAMLKNGKLVALDTTEALIQRISGSQLILKLEQGVLPESLNGLVSQLVPSSTGDKYLLRISHANEIEQILREVRESGAVVADMELQQADLEDVFLQVMEGGEK